MMNAQGKSVVNPTESETTCPVGNLSRRSRETSAASVSPMETDRSEKARSHNPDMHVAAESDSSIAPEKPANQDGVPSSAELAEGRELTKENTGQSLLRRTSSRTSDGKLPERRSHGLHGVYDKLQRRIRSILTRMCGLLVNIQGKSRRR